MIAAFSVNAATLYEFTQSGAGTNSGANLANAKSIAQINVFALSGDDTARANGTITSQWVISSSGTNGHPVNYVFATGAKFSATTWPDDPTFASGIIFGNGKSYFTIDGISSGIIEATANGEHLANQNNFAAITLTSCDHFNIQNLTVQNLYVRVNGDTGRKCVGVQLNNWGGNSVVDHCVINYAYFGVWSGYGSGHTGFTVSNSTMNYCAEQVVHGDNSINQTTSVVRIFGNSFDHSSVWYDAADATHADCIHLQAVNGGTSNIDDVQIYQNYFGPDISAHQTAQVYPEGFISNYSIYNNLFLTNATACTNGSVYAKTSGAGSILNNTATDVAAGGQAMNISGAAGSVTLENNIISGFAWATYLNGSSRTVVSDYNDFFNNTSGHQTSEGAHSISGDPKLNANLSLQSGSPAIGTGLNLSAQFTGDYYGHVRSIPFDMGAIAFSTSAFNAATFNVGTLKYGL